MNYSEMDNDALWLEVSAKKGHPVEWYAWAGKRYLRDRVTTKLLPNWLTDIGAAWELVEEMSGLEHVTIENNGDCEWVCYTDDYARTLSGTAPTASRAICISWLMWKDNQA